MKNLLTLLLIIISANSFCQSQVDNINKHFNDSVKKHYLEIFANDTTKVLLLI